MQYVDRPSMYKVRSQYTRRFMRFIRPWLRELVRRWKDRGRYPAGPWDIGHYYTRPDDIEAAAYATLAIHWDGCRGKTTTRSFMSAEMNALKRIMGEDAGKWFRKRGFVQIGIPSERNKRIAGLGSVTQGFIADTLDRIWQARREGLDDEFLYVTELKHMKLWKVECMKMLFHMPDGIGLGLRGCLEPMPYSRPFSNEKDFLSLWIPDYKEWMNYDTAVEMLELRRSSDLIYAMWGWQNIARSHPKECRHFADVYRKRYMNMEEVITENTKILRDGIPDYPYTD